MPRVPWFGPFYVNVWHISRFLPKTSEIPSLSNLILNRNGSFSFYKSPAVARVAFLQTRLAFLIIVQQSHQSIRGSCLGLLATHFEHCRTNLSFKTRKILSELHQDSSWPNLINGFEMHSKLHKYLNILEETREVRSVLN